MFLRGSIEYFTPKMHNCAWFATKARMQPVKCAPSNSYVPPPMGAVGDTLYNRALGCERKNTWNLYFRDSFMVSYPRWSEWGERLGYSFIFLFNTSSVLVFIQTREAVSSSSWLVYELMEWLLDALGALMGKGGCRDMVACRWLGSSIYNLHFHSGLF